MPALSGSRNGVGHRAGIAAEVRRESGCHDLEVFDAFRALWNESNETLPADADIFVVVIGTIDGEMVASAAQSVDGKLARRSDADTDRRTFAARERNSNDARSEQRELIERPAASKWNGAQNRAVVIPADR